MEKEYNYFNPVDDPFQYITDNLNAKQSTIRSLLGKMN